MFSSSIGFVETRRDILHTAFIFPLLLISIRAPLFVRIFHPRIVKCLPLVGNAATLTISIILLLMKLLMRLVSTFIVVLLGSIIVVLTLIIAVIISSLLISLVLVLILTLGGLSLVLTLLPMFVRLLVLLLTKGITASATTHRAHHVISKRWSSTVASPALNFHQLLQARSKDPFRFPQQAQTIVLPGLRKGREGLHLVLEDGPKHSPLFGRGALH